MLIRAEQLADWPAIRAVNQAAFEAPAEANLVDTLREQSQAVLSLVAVEDDARGDEVVGHILFSPVSLTGHPDLKIAGLAPIAVLPGHQRKGIGSALIRAGIEHCRELGFGAIVVLGHTDYYPRFGFSPAVRFGIRCEYDVPVDAFMLIELHPGYFSGASGTILYHESFRDV